MKCVTLYADGLGSPSPYYEKHWLRAYCDGEHIVLEREWYFPPSIEDESSKSSTEVERTRTSKEVLSKMLYEVIRKGEGRIRDDESQEDHASTRPEAKYSDTHVRYDPATEVFVVRCWNKDIELPARYVGEHVTIGQG